MLGRINRWPFLLLGVQLLAFWPIWIWYYRRMNDGSDEPWGVLALIVALFFLSRIRWANEAKESWLIGSCILTMVYLLTGVSFPPLIRAALALASIGSLLLALGLPTNLRTGVFGLLVLSLPIVASLQFFLGFPIRFVTTWFAAKLIGCCGYDVFSEGTRLVWGSEVVLVDVPCSGIKMFWSGMFLNFFLACLNKLSPLRAWFAYLASSAMIFLGNLIRATLLFFFEAQIWRSSFDPHQFVGLAVFVLVACGIIVSASLLGHRSIDSLVGEKV